MKFRKLGNTNLDVSLICLGTMTWGTQNSQDEAFEQMDYSIDQGINFLILRNYTLYLQHPSLMVKPRK